MKMKWGAEILVAIESSHRIYCSARDVSSESGQFSLLCMWTIFAIKYNIPVVFKCALLGDTCETLWSL